MHKIMITLAVAFLTTATLGASEQTDMMATVNQLVEASARATLRACWPPAAMRCASSTNFRLMSGLGWALARNGSRRELQGGFPPQQRGPISINVIGRRHESG